MHPDFKDAEGNLQELRAMKKHFTIEVEGDSDAGCAMSDIIWHVDLREGKEQP